MPFYAVRVGRRPGIYTTWAECLEQTSGFSGSSYAKFVTPEEAQDFMEPPRPGQAAKSKKNVVHNAQERVKLAGEPFTVKKTDLPISSLGKRTIAKRPLSSMNGDAVDPEKRSLVSHRPSGGKYPTPRPINDPAHNIYYLDSDSRSKRTALIVYTDGACPDNGRHKARAGYGVHVPSRPDLDEHGALSTCSRPTNQRAELTAILRAIEVTAGEAVPLEVRTDSMYSINCLTAWYRAWEKEDWKVDKKNLDLIQEIIAACRKRPYPVYFVCAFESSQGINVCSGM